MEENTSASSRESSEADSLDTLYMRLALELVNK